MILSLGFDQFIIDLKKVCKVCCVRSCFRVEICLPWGKGASSALHRKNSIQTTGDLYIRWASSVLNLSCKLDLTWSVTKLPLRWVRCWNKTKISLIRAIKTYSNHNQLFTQLIAFFNTFTYFIDASVYFDALLIILSVSQVWCCVWWSCISLYVQFLCRHK